MILSLLILAGAYFVLKLTRLGYESAPYTVVLTDGRFALRDYSELVLVSAPMDDPDPQEGSSFMNLFGYISGDNESGEKIAMTTPVITSRKQDQLRMSFVVPTEVAQSGAPKATNERVRLDTMPGGRFAVYRSPAKWSRESREQAKSELARWIQEQGLQPMAEPLVANYDPPFTPAILQRNEILIRVAE